MTCALRPRGQSRKVSRASNMRWCQVGGQRASRAEAWTNTPSLQSLEAEIHCSVPVDEPGPPTSGDIALPHPTATLKGQGMAAHACCHPPWRQLRRIAGHSRVRTCSIRSQRMKPFNSHTVRSRPWIVPMDTDQIIPKQFSQVDPP